MPKNKKKIKKQPGISFHISDSVILDTVKGSGAWIVKHFTRAILPALIAALGTVGGYAIGNSSHTPEARANLSASTTAQASWIKISSPISGETVPRCTSISGTADLPAGDYIWVLDQGQNALDYYVKGSASTTPTADSHVVNWSYPKSTIGAADKGGSFVITAVIVNGATNDFLNGLVSAEDLKKFSGGLADTSALPGVAATVDVERAANESTACA